MIAGNLYPQKANITKNKKGSGRIRTLLFCSLFLLSMPAIAQTYYNVTNVSGTTTVGGNNVTVTSAGVVSSAPCAGLSQPYIEGQDITTSTFGVGSYTWSFSTPVNAVRLHIESINPGDDISVTINGTSYFITSANVSALAAGSTCQGSTGNAVAFGGNLVNSTPGNNTATLDINPGFGISTITVQSLGGGNGVINDFMFTANNAPVFVNGTLQIFSLCQASTAYNISSMLAVQDVDQTQTETYTVTTNAMHGTLNGFPATITSNGDTVTPAGLTYTPTAAYSGFDTFVVQVSDGIASALDTIVVIVKPLPTLSSDTVLSPICSGSLVSYAPTSPVAGTSFNWNRPFLSGISNPAATGLGNPNENLTNVTYYNLTVDYIYTMVADGCTNTQSVTVVVKPTPSLTSATTVALCNNDSLVYVPTVGTDSTTFTWTRDSIAGIAEGPSTGTDTIRETLINTTTSPINVIYTFVLSANGCTAVRTVTVTVAPSVAGVGITTKPGTTSLCGGANSLNFGAAVAPAPGITYTWSAVNATINAIGTTGQYSLISFNTPGTAVVTLTSTIPGAGCSSTDTYTATISENENPTHAVIYNNYQFVYLDNTQDTYQWGYDNAATLDSTIADGASFQSYPNATPDLTDNLYWVITTKNGCMQKTYFNAPLAVSNVATGASMKLYPNPATSSVTVTIDAAQGGTTEVALVNMLGQTVQTISGTGNTKQFDVTALPAGVYLVSCTQHGVKIATGRFIKN